MHPLARWGSFIGFLLIYALRVYLKDGWFIVTYGLGIYLLNLFIGFLTPAVRCPSLFCSDGVIFLRIISAYHTLCTCLTAGACMFLRAD